MNRLNKKIADAKRVQRESEWQHIGPGKDDYGYPQEYWEAGKTMNNYACIVTAIRCCRWPLADMVDGYHHNELWNGYKGDKK